MRYTHLFSFNVYHHGRGGTALDPSILSIKTHIFHPKILSQLLLPSLAYSLISLQTTLGGNHHPPRHPGALGSCKCFWLSRKPERYQVNSLFASGIVVLQS
jgi:hypothetical protein